MILFISNSGESCPIAYRMMKEHVDVMLYIHAPSYRRAYNGMLPKCGLTDLRKIARKAELVIFDITRANAQIKEDVALLKSFGVSTRSPEVFGAVASRMARHTKVIGASEYTASIELDRMDGEHLAEDVGLDLPTTMEFDRLSEAVEFLNSDEGKKTRWVFKPDNNQDLDLTYMEKYPGELRDKLTHEYMVRISEDKFPHILQEVVHGVEISTEGWFDGSKFVHFNHTIEDKRLMNGNLGPATGSQSNTVWIKNGGLLVPELSRLAPKLNQAGYIGPVDINTIVTKDKAYFLEWTPRFGYDAIYNLLTLYKGRVSSFFQSGFMADWKPGFASSQRITIPPYPYSDRGLLKEFARDVSVWGTFNTFWAEDVYFDGSLRCAGSDGLVGVISAYGKTLGESINAVYQSIGKLKISSYIQYRTDLGRRTEKAIKQFQKWGIDYGKENQS